MQKYTDRDYYSQREGGNAPEGFEGTGYYQRVTLPEIVASYMANFSDDGDTTQNITETKCQFLAQRAIQEFSYDVFRPVKGIETDLDDRLSIVMPQDFVEAIQVSWLDNAGYKHPMAERRFSGNPNDYSQDSEGNFLYDSEGRLIAPEKSRSLTRFEVGDDTDSRDAFYNYYAGSFENDELYDRYYSYFGRRFGLEPEAAFLNSTYVVDYDLGVIFFANNVRNNVVVIDYISDGLANNPEDIQAHKFAEEAIYAYITYMHIKNKSDIPLYEKNRSQKEYMTLKRNAKHRLSKISTLDISRTMKGKQKWIKH